MHLFFTPAMPTFDMDSGVKVSGANLYSNRYIYLGEDRRTPTCNAE